MTLHRFTVEECRTFAESFRWKSYILQRGEEEVLFSYGVPIMSRIPETGEFRRFWPCWTATTGRHIKRFSGLAKKEWDKMPITQY